MAYKITKTRECIVCGKTFLFSRNKIACSPECSKVNIKQKYDEGMRITMKNKRRLEEEAESPTIKHHT